jgi:hypothetical protein
VAGATATAAAGVTAGRISDLLTAKKATIRLPFLFPAE